jgi:hypothetical protein
VNDGNGGGKRPTSAAFKDARLSVDAEEILSSLGLDWRFSLKDYPEHLLVRFPIAAARAKQLDVVHAPLLQNQAHAEVRGKKTPAIAVHLRDASTWVKS